MSDWFRRFPIVCWSLVAYLLLSGLALAGFGGSGLFDRILFLWPYLFILALEAVAGPVTNSKLGLGLAVGLVAIVVTGGIAQKLVGTSRPDGRSAVALGAFVALMTLGVLTGTAFLLAAALGWPVGE